MKIAIRLDDITPNMDWQKFRRFRKLLDAYGVKPLVGIVPDNRDVTLMRDPMREDFWELVREWEKAGWSVAMHGLHHLYMTESRGMFPLNRKSEFAGLAYEQQYKMVYEGRLILDAHDIKTDVFMAPSHTYDRNTLTALIKNGFTRVTDGYGAAPYIRDNITFYPIAVSRERVLEATADPSPTTLVVHTNTLTEENFRFYEEVFKTQQMLPFSDYLNMEAVPRGFFGNLKEYLIADTKRVIMERREKRAERALERSLKKG